MIPSPNKWSLHLKLNDAMNLLQAIQVLQNSTVARKINFGYMLAYNRRVLETVQQDVQTALRDEATDALIAAYDEERVALLREAARKDADGNPVIEGDRFVIDDQERVLPQIQRRLEDRHGPAMRAIADRNAKLADLLNEEQYIKLRKLPLAEWPDLPEDVPPSAMNAILDLVEAD
jgi:hypothetical protein